MTDDKMERCARLQSAYSPEDWPLDPSPDPFPHERVKWRGAIVFGHLAALAIGIGIGLALNP